MGRIGIFLLVFSITVSCELNILQGLQNPKEPKTVTFDYYPVVEGSEYIYRFDSIDFNKRIYDTVKYWQRYVVGVETKTLDNKTFREVEIYVKEKWEQPWTRIRTDYIAFNQLEANRFSENVMYRKLVYPPEEGKVWNATPNNETKFLYGSEIAFNETKYEKVHWHEIKNNRGFDSTLTVVNFEYYDLVDRYNFRELYANHVGLIYKVEMAANFQDPNNEPEPDTSTFVPKSGYKLTQVLVDFKIPSK